MEFIAGEPRVRSSVRVWQFQLPGGGRGLAVRTCSIRPITHANERVLGEVHEGVDIFLSGENGHLPATTVDRCPHSTALVHTQAPMYPGAMVDEVHKSSGVV